MDKQQLQAATDAAINVLRYWRGDFTNAFPSAASEKGFYKQKQNDDWTEGFLTGQYWLAWELCGEEAFRATALRHVDSFAQRIRRRVVVDHHDMGFLYLPSCVAAWRLAGSETGKAAALLAAENLAARFQEKGGFVQAWGKLGDPAEYRLIIDSLMNMPLLFWAARETGTERYAEIARRHISTTLAHVVREDGSAYHTFFFDPETGAPLRGATAQGYAPDSAWARGQAWGVYGTALAYRYTGNKAYAELFYHVADYYLTHLPEDGIPYWDLCFTAKDDEERDSSAAAIAACGMLEMATLLPGLDAAYPAHAEEVAATLAQAYTLGSPLLSNGLLQHGVYAKSTPFNTVSSNGVDECNAWGDYFYLELLARLQGVQSLFVV